MVVGFDDLVGVEVVLVDDGVEVVAGLDKVVGVEVVLVDEVVEVVPALGGVVFALPGALLVEPVVF